MSIGRRSCGWTSEAGDFIKNPLKKSMETFTFVKVCMNSVSFMEMRILLKIEVTFML